MQTYLYVSRNPSFLWRGKCMSEPMRSTWTLPFPASRDLNFGFGSSESEVFAPKIGGFIQKAQIHGFWSLKPWFPIPIFWEPNSWFLCRGVSHAVATAAYRRPAQCLSGDGYRGLANSSHSTGKVGVSWDWRLTSAAGSGEGENALRFYCSS